MRKIGTRFILRRAHVTRKVKWGVISTANIGVQKVLPAMQLGELTSITAIASRNLEKAKETAQALRIPKYFGSYEELLRDDEIEAIYNPLPNHLHVPWTIKCMEAGKHVLCEKPIALTTKDAKKLIEVRDRTGVKAGEAFMVKTHPQWLRTLELIKKGEIGDLRAIHGYFSYFNRDPNNIRNILEIGGGSIWDIGCYPVTTSRFVFGEEPRRVISLIERDPEMKIDRLASVIMDFPSGHATFTSSTQLARYQKMIFFGTEQRIEIEIPFNAPPDRPCRIYIDGDLQGLEHAKAEEIPTCNQYTIQGEEFSKAVLGERDVPVPLEDALKNTAVLLAIFRSAQSNSWEIPEI
jgi:predicted dehydrogenase